MIADFTGTPIFGVVLTLTAFAVGKLLYKKTGLSILHPVITSSIIIMTVLLISGIRIEDYQEGGSMISFMLGPATVALAVPLYRQIEILKTHAVIIITSITVGAVVSVVSVILLARMLDLPEQLTLSLVPKSITTPIAVELSEKIEGLPSITAMAVIFTGIFGAVAGPSLLRFLRVEDPAAKGLAMGTSAHAIGTSRAIEMGEVEGALSSLSIGLAGIITAVSAPFIISLFF